MHRSTLPRAARTAGLAALLSTSLVACGGGDDGGSSGPSGPSGANPVAVAGYDSLKFDAKKYTAKPGEVTFLLTNEGNLQHTLLIDDVDDFRLSVASSGASDEGTVELDAGTYTLYCDVAGHQAGGMEATLTVW